MGVLNDPILEEMLAELHAKSIDQMEELRSLKNDETTRTTKLTASGLPKPTYEPIRAHARATAVSVVQ